MGKTVAIIQARLGSSRLPAKVLLPLGDMTVLERVIDRCHSIKGVDEVVVAIPEHDTELLQSCSEATVCYGPEGDVLNRYWQAANKVNAAHIMRITADCPMINPFLCAHVLEQYRLAKEQHGQKSWFYASNVFPRRTFPKGWDVEVFPLGLLNRAACQAHTPTQREHVTPFMQAWAAEAGRVINVTQRKDFSDVSYTLDTLADYRQIWRLVSGIEERIRDAEVLENLVPDA